MQKPLRHILVCGSFRMNGLPQGVCAKSGSGQLLQYLQEELSDRGLLDVVVSCTSCLKVCDRGPAIVVYPDNWWFGHVDNEEAIDAIIESLGTNTPNEKYKIA
jgi:(2Fe-2S) ferredoxin